MHNRPSKLLFVILAVGLGSGCRVRQDQPESEPSSQSDSEPSTKPVATGPVRIVYPAAPGSFVNLAKELRPSVVHLRSASVSGGPGNLIPGVADSRALGSAFVYTRDGLLITSEHLIRTAPAIRAVLSTGEEVDAEIVGRDRKLDLALLRIKVTADKLTPIRLGDSDVLQVGEWVLALGNPHGTEVTASAGIISALGISDYDSIAGSKTNYHSFLRTDAKIDAANTGGPLVDTSGAVVGINSAVANQSGEMRLVVPINRARQIFPMLERDGEVTRAWLGVFVHPVTPIVAKERKLDLSRALTTGALVSDVLPMSPAAKAGVKAGDIILEFDGKAVDHRSLPLLASIASVGKSVELVVHRSGQSRTLQLVSEKMP